MAAEAHARVFQFSEITGIFNFSLSYGFVARVEGRDRDLIGVGNGGNADTVNRDDGNLNYDPGIVSNQLRGTSELALRWRNFGAFVRGYGFYDFETEIGDTERTNLSNDAKWEIGSGAELQDAYLSAQFSPWGMPVQLRVGNQVLNWGESNFLRFGVDIVNPIDLVALGEPTSSSNDIFRRQGMVWGVASLTETLAVEAFYQYDWEPVRLPPVGSFLSVDDIIGSDGLNVGYEGFGQFSDQGTDLGEAFGADPGVFDPDFMQLRGGGRDKPDEGGQFGFALQAVVPALNATKLTLNFVNYHSRLPLLNGFTADQETVDTTDDAGVDTTAAALGVSRADAETITISRLANGSRVFATYPENIRMVGLSFSSATIRTGTLLSGEVAHHVGWPVQVPKEEVIVATLSPVEYTGDSADVFRSTSLGVFGASEKVKGWTRTDKTQLSFSLGQLFGPQLRAAQSFLTFDVGWVHIHDLPGSSPFDDDSWGYRLIGGLSYDGLFGGISLRPTLIFTHDVDGITPGPGVAFIEDRKTVSARLEIQYTQRWTALLAYLTSFDAEKVNLRHDRDLVRFNMTFHY